MCDKSEERTYYIRTSLMYTDLTREVLFKVFKFLIKSDDITGFLSYPEQQNVLRELFQRNVLNQPDYNLVSSHVLNLERFDISLLVRLILNLCKDNILKPQHGWKAKPHPKDESLGADLLRLRDVRNKIIGHRADGKLSEAEYKKTWAKIKVILLRVVELVDLQSRDNFEQRINEYKRLNVGTENAEVRMLLDELLTYKKEFDHLQEKLEELSRKSREFQKYFETTPEIFVRYIKLLFDGGRIVLCGILKTKLGDLDLSDFLEIKKETLIRNIDEKFSGCLYSKESCSDYKNWDVFLLASVLLHTCEGDLSENEIMHIERIKTARVNYAALALQSLDTVDFLTNWTDLIICLKDLSSNIAKDDKLQVEHLIERYKKKDEGGCDAEEYFKQLSESGVEVKTLNDVYNETIKELRDMLNQMSQKDIKFEKGYVFEYKLLTICENEEIKKEAENLLEINLQASIQRSDQPSGSIRRETDKAVAIIAAHPDVTPLEVKRKCIIWSFKCSTPGGLLHILDIIQGDLFRNTFRNIAYEMHYIYGYAFLIQGMCTLESVSGVLRMLNKSSTYEASSEHISIPLKCSSVDGINSVLSAIRMEKTTNSLNRIAEQMSAEFKETVSIKLIPEMMEFRNVLEETDSEGSSSLERNEDETEEKVPAEMDNENNNGNEEEHVDFIIDNKYTPVNADETETDKEVQREHDENNEMSAAQRLYDEKMKDVTENEESERNIKTVSETFQTINLGQTRIQDLTIGEKRNKSKIDNENDNGNREGQVNFNFYKKCTLVHATKTDKEVVRGHADDEMNNVSAAQKLYDKNESICNDKISVTRCSESEGSSSLDSSSTDATEAIVPGAMGIDKFAVVHDERLQQRITYNELKPNYCGKKFANEAACYLKEGLKDCIVKFSKENFKQIRLKVLKMAITKECRNCPIETLLPVHSSQHGRCPLGQMNCNCVSPGDTKPCPSNFCDVMYDEIIKQHRTSSDRWFATSNDTTWHQNHWEIIKFFLSSDQHTIRYYDSIEFLRCVDFLDIMVNNLEFQKEISCQIDPPSDVVSKIRSYLRNKVYKTDDDIFKDVVHNMITILTSIINQMPSTRIAVQKLQQLEKRYDAKNMFTRRGFQNKSDKLKISIKMWQPSIIGDQEKMERFPSKSVGVDIREKQYEDTTKKTDIHIEYVGFETEDPILLPKDEFERVLLGVETSCKMLTENKTDVTERKLLILQDKIEYLIQASGSSAATSFQRQNLDSIRKSFLNIKKMFLLGVASSDMEYQAKKQGFREFLFHLRRMHTGYYRYSNANLESLESLYLYSHEDERICSKKDIFYPRGALSKNIVVSGSTSSCKKFCVFLEENYSRLAKWPDNEFEYVFRLSLRYVKETHIHDIIKNHILKRSIFAYTFEQVLFREADKCLIILEELDKWIPYEYDELDTKNRRLSKARRKDQLPQRNHMTDYVVLVTTEDKNVENIKLGKTDRLLYLKDSYLYKFCKKVSQGEKYVQPDRDSNLRPSKYRSAALPTKVSSHRLFPPLKKKNSSEP